MLDGAFAPLAGLYDLVALLVRIMMGGVMMYYGWPKVKDPRKNAEDFGKGGFTPGWFWGTIVLLVEFVGGISVVVGFYTWVAAALIGIEMLTGTVWKIGKAHKPFTDDVLDVARTRQLALARRTSAWQAVAWRDLDASLDRYAILTPRERQVLHLVAEGHMTSEIAGLLEISAKTVEIHRANLMRKLGARNQTDLVRYALRQELRSSSRRSR